MFNTTSRPILYSTEGVILPFSHKVLTEKDIDVKVDSLKSNLEKLSSSKAKRNTHGGKNFRIKKVVNSNQMQKISEKIQVLETAKKLIFFAFQLNIENHSMSKRYSLISSVKKKEVLSVATITQMTALATFEVDIFAHLDMSQFPKEALDHINYYKKLIGFVKEVGQKIKYPKKEIAILGDLYVPPKFRGVGNSSRLIERVKGNVFRNSDIKCIVLMPDPFEYENNVQKSLIGTVEYEEKKDCLQKLYQKQGFIPADSDPFFMYIEKKTQN